MNKRWIINILDKSSMVENLKSSIIDEYNKILQTSKNSNLLIRWTDIDVTDHIKIVQDDIIDNIQEIINYQISSSSKLSFLDALGQVCCIILKNSIVYINVTINIFTFGKENNSKCYTTNSVNDLLGVIKEKYHLISNIYYQDQKFITIINQMPMLEYNYNLVIDSKYSTPISSSSRIK